MDIFCRSCGCLFEAQRGVCPRCTRCPQCGAKNRHPLEQCSNCAHPTDAKKLAELGQILDPTLPRNQREIRSLDNSWQEEQMWKRVPVWKACVASTAVILVYTLLFTLPLFWFADFLHINGSWLQAANLLFALLIVMPLLRRQFRRGKFPWLLRPETPIRQR